MLLAGFRHTDLGEWSCEASDLGLAPGSWPETFETILDGRPYTAYRRMPHLDGQGELTHMSYETTPRGVRLIVWND